MRQDQPPFIERARGQAARAFRATRSLLRDRRGSTMAMLCAALIPLLGMIGSGLDIARAYTAQARLQQACDAAALAGRRVMTGDVINTAVTDEANKFLNFNFPQSMFSTAAFTPTITRPRAGTVAIRAETTMPTMIMKIFGYNTLPIKASCDASQEFMNVDVVFVLDNTGSMDEEISKANGTKIKKIQALRDAVMAFYDQMKPVQDNLKANGYRLRYGIVPYSSTVNVGRLLLAANANNVRTSAPYMRVTNFAFYGGDVDVWWTTQTINHDSTWMSNWKGCIEERETFPTNGNTPTAAELAAVSSPALRDLNIDGLATSAEPATQWIPADPDAQLSALGAFACPAEAVRLKEWTRDDLDKYVKGLVPTGSTYLDIGMIWGARFISDTGVFADSPLTFNGARNNKYIIFLTDGDMDPQPISYSAWGVELMQRRITPGPAPNPILRAFTSAALIDGAETARHNGRFDVLCQAAKGKASVWTVKIANNRTDTRLESCANPNQFKVVVDEAELRAQFALIAQQITELRLAL